MMAETRLPDRPADLHLGAGPHQVELWLEALVDADIGFGLWDPHCVDGLGRVQTPQRTWHFRDLICHLDEVEPLALWLEAPSLTPFQPSFQTLRFAKTPNGIEVQFAGFAHPDAAAKGSQKVGHVLRLTHPNARAQSAPHGLLQAKHRLLASA